MSDTFILVLFFIVVLVMLALAFVGTGLFRGALACKHCHQRELGCPAERLFNRKRASCIGE